MSQELKPGATAPDFTLKDHQGNEVNLSDYRGRKVVLGFHPLAWTGVCAEQMKNLESSFEKLEGMGAVAFGISVDSAPCKKAWAESLGIEHTPLLSDFWPHGKVISTYGIFREEQGISERATFVLDGDGKIAFGKVYPIKEVPDMDEILSAVEKA
jgi:peroxiredoxin